MGARRSPADLLSAVLGCVVNPKFSTMAIFKTVISQPRRALCDSFLVLNSLCQQSVSSLAQSDFELNQSIQSEDDNGRRRLKQQEDKKEKNPLHQMFEEAVAVRSKREMSHGESGDERYMIKNLKKLEMEISRLNEVKAEERIDGLEESTSDEKAVRTGSLSGMFREKNAKRDQRQDCVEESIVKARSLSGLFSGENKRRERRQKRVVEMEAAAAAAPPSPPVMLKKLSPDMLFFVEELYKGGYFYDANFLPGNVLDASYFDQSYSRDYIKYAADTFAKDHQEIAKWLSGSQVKTVALYGCPNLVKNSIFAAKRLRTFFRIQEDTVCGRCILRDLCRFVNQSVWGSDNKNLKLDDTLRVLISYASEEVHPKLTLPDDYKATVNHILRDIINLSKTTI